MSLPEDISAHLPKPDPGEPAALRQDIADELADHLHCAARREHLQNHAGSPLSEQEALAAAIERFGEPAMVARRLWWDAMKERIMAQRMLTVMATAVAVGSLFVCFMLWQSMQTARNQQAELIDSQREAMTAMAAQFKQFKSTTGDDSTQWQNLAVSLVDENNKGVAGVVKCSASVGSISDEKYCAAGQAAEFLLPPGPYNANVIVGDFSAGVSLLIPPGRDTKRTITCPTPDLKRSPLAFQVDRTDAPDDPEIYYIAHVQFITCNVGGLIWYRQTPTPDPRWLLDPQGRVLRQLPAVPLASYVPGISISSVDRRREAIFPKQLLANLGMPSEEGLIPGAYLIDLAPYVADKEALPTGELHPSSTPTAGPYPPPTPALRAVFAPGAAVQLTADTQNKNFDAARIDNVLINWQRLHEMIVGGPLAPSAQAPPGYPQAPYPQPASAFVPPPYSAPAAFDPYQAPAPAARNVDLPGAIPAAAAPPAARPQ